MKADFGQFVDYYTKMLQSKANVEKYEVHEMCGKIVYKYTFLEKLESLVKICTNQSELVIFYSGDGLISTGDWVFTQKYFYFDLISDVSVNLEEIFELMDKNDFAGRLSIICDSSHSGQWAYQA